MLEIVFWCSIIFQPNLADLQPETALISTAGKPTSGGPQTASTIMHKPQSNLRGVHRICGSDLVAYQQVDMYSGLDFIRCSSLSDNQLTNDHKENRNLQILISHE